MALHKGFEILVGSPLTVGVLSRFGRLCFPLFVPDFSWKVNIPDIKYALVNVIVDGSAGKLNFFGMVWKYVAYRLPVKYQWREQFVQPSRLFFRSVNVFSWLRQERTALFVRFVGWIVCVLFAAVILLRAASAYIRRFVQKLAPLRNKLFAQIVAATRMTGLAGSKAGCASAQFPLVTWHIICANSLYGCNEFTFFPDLARNSRCTTPDYRSYLSKTALKR